MAVVLVPDVGASNANSYVAVAEGDTYFSDRADASAWNGATGDEKGRALIRATDRIDQEEFEGQTVKPLNGAATNDPTQALKWPRLGVVDDEGWVYDDDVIPARVKKATMELALEILRGGTSLVETGLEGIQEVTLGPLELTPRHTPKAGALSAHVRRFLQPLLTTASGLNFRMGRA